VRRMLLAVTGIIGSCGVIILLFLQVKPIVFTNSELAFQPTAVIASPQREQSIEASVSKPITLPCTVEGTGLIAERLICYDGVFFENGSNCEVEGVAALLLRNTSKTGISSAHIVLEQKCRKLTFEATQIPPGVAVLVLEKCAIGYTKECVTACYGRIDWESFGWNPEDLLRFEELDMGSLWVTNVSGSDLCEINLYYKTDYADGMFYMGGITYHVYIDNIDVGERILLKPDHYAGNASKFLRIEYTTQ